MPRRVDVAEEVVCGSGRIGNGSGDFAMAKYACDKPDYSGEALLVPCDDTEREHGDPDKAASVAQMRANGGASGPLDKLGARGVRAVPAPASPVLAENGTSERPKGPEIVQKSFAVAHRGTSTVQKSRFLSCSYT